MENLFSQKTIGVIVAALLIVGSGVYFYGASQEKNEAEGKTALYQIQTTYEDELKALPEAEKATNSSIDVDQKFSKTVAKLNEMLTSKSVSKRVRYDAGIKLGTLYLDHNQAQKAVPVLKTTVSDAKNGFLKASAAFLLGNSEERANQYKDAIETYQSGLSQNVEGLKGELLLGMVRSSMKLNDKEKAKLYSEKLNKEAPGSRSSEEAASLVKGM